MHEIFEHTADLGLRATAPTLDLLMAEAARGLFEIIAGELAQIRPRRDHAERFDVAGTDPLWLLFDWICELHAAFELRRMLFCEFEVTIDAAGLHANAHGERYDWRGLRHQLRRPPHANEPHARRYRACARWAHQPAAAGCAGRSGAGGAITCCRPQSSACSCRRACRS